MFPLLFYYLGYIIDGVGDIDVDDDNDNEDNEVVNRFLLRNSCHHVFTSSNHLTSSCIVHLYNCL